MKPVATVQPLKISNSIDTRKQNKSRQTQVAISTKNKQTVNGREKYKIKGHHVSLWDSTKQQQQQSPNSRDIN